LRQFFDIGNEACVQRTAGFAESML